MNRPIDSWTCGVLVADSVLPAVHSWTLGPTILFFFLFLNKELSIILISDRAVNHIGSVAHRLSWLWLTSLPLLTAGGPAANRCSSMGQRFRLGVEHPHHRRRHRGGRVPATHRHCGTRRGNSPPPSDAVLRILFTVFFFFLNAAVVFF